MIPLRIISRDFELSDAMSAAVEKHVEKLGTFYERIMHCEVVISEPHQHQNKGRVYHVLVKVHVPGGDIVVSREPERNGAHEDFYVALRDAFRAITRRLEDRARKVRGDVKRERHVLPHARVVRLFPIYGYGFIQTPDGQELYFHRNSVLNDDFENLQVGSEVRFTSEMGGDGPQVTSMSLVGKGGHAFASP